MINSDTPPTLYAQLGGDEVLRQLVDQFYDRMDQDPSFAPLRAMHAADLGIMRSKLADWMSGWLGGPPLYDARDDATCIGHAHAPFRIDAEMRDQWIRCMFTALDDIAVTPSVQAKLRPPISALAEFLRNH